MTTAGVDVRALLGLVAESAERAGVFGAVNNEGERLVCPAANSAEPAFYGVESDAEGAVWVSLIMEDRWQSESIEADLVHTGDKLEELLDEELAELGYSSESAPAPTYQHYRSEDMQFTFRSAVPLDGLDAAASAERVSQWLLGYEACFRQLGDMDTTEED
ncbi:MAG: hypothetical protein AAFS11_01565 [Planctomycetota bacterium]